MTEQTIKIRRALLSVSDKSGLLELAQALKSQDCELLSTGGTAAALEQADIPVQQVSDHTGFPEIMAGRVKTLHPKIHGGILGRRGSDEAVMAEHQIAPIDLIVVNLYPFQQTIAKPGCRYDDAIENIDIGGPAMVRAAAKNHDGVAIVVDPEDYPEVISAMTQGGISLTLRKKLAAKAFAHTAAYDGAIAAYLADQQDDLAQSITLSLPQKQSLRYGENPHQKAAFYANPKAPQGSLAAAQLLQGKALSFNNLADADAALACVRDFEQPACVIVKHANPCGVAVDGDIQAAYERAFATDATSAFGGIIAFNRELDAQTAKLIINRQFVEVLIAPAVTASAVEALAEKPNVRVLETGPLEADGGGLKLKSVSGGLLVQSADHALVQLDQLKIVSKRQPDAQQLADMMFAWRVVKHVKSNAIVYAKDNQTIGIGAGQMSRVVSARIASIKAEDAGMQVESAAMASDAFFPFRDGIDAAAKVGIGAIVQPGGSMRDAEVIAAADEHGIVMALTGIRHFNH